MTEIEIDTATTTAPGGLHHGFRRSVAAFGDRPALEVDGRTLTYRDLDSRARAIASVLSRATPPGGSPVTAVFAYKSETAFAGVLAALFRGHAYVALNRRFPPGRTRMMLEKADARALVVDRESAAQLEEVLDGYQHPLLLLLPDVEDVTALAERFPRHTVLGADAIETRPAWEPAEVDLDAIAYLIFTSGSTGTPKAVMVPHRSIRRYVDLMAERWQVTEHDRFSQTFDMTFDLSVSDMFVAWERGACLCCLTPQQVVKPGKAIREARITVWYAVPSVGLLMKRLGMLRPGSYPDVRLVLFCGEPLPTGLAEAWTEAAPNAIVENVYGPTEVTITCAIYRWDPARSPSEAEFGVVPIGYFYPGMEPLVLDEEGREVGPGEEGELYVAGPQVTPGYWRDPERTAAAFFVPPGKDEIHYKTGDRVRRPVGERPFTYLGRVDFQVKISGHRVELGEIEAVLRDETGVDEVVAMGWPPIETGYAAVTAFVRAPAELDVEGIRERMAARLPDYMVPRQIHSVEEMPLNVNGKFDRRALLERLEDAS